MWAIATYMVLTNLKGISSMKLHRDLDVTQKTAWQLAHRLRAAVALGALGGRKGGPARAAKLSPEQRREIATKAARARWANRARAEA